MGKNAEDGLGAFQSRIEDGLRLGREPTTAELRQEYILLAERNRGLVIDFSRHVRKLLVLLVVLLMGLGVVAMFAAVTSYNLEGRTCKIQNVGLKAQPHLTKIMYDINGVVQPLKGEAPAPKEIQAYVENLREELAAYVYFERHQPAGRSC